jgi:ComF family protein
MVESWPSWKHQPDLVIPIPLHPEREKERGYNQAALLSRGICRQLELESDEAALRRIRHTRPQVGLDRAQRRENVRGAFAAKKARVSGKHLLLVDDVCTTGATLGAAAEALLDRGANSVSGYCIARPVEL